MNMSALPAEVVCGGILPHLSVCDLQALDTAFTNKYLRPELQQVWQSYQYDDFDVSLKEYDVHWLCSIGVRIISLTIDGPTAKTHTLLNIRTLKRLCIELSVHCDIILNLAMNNPELEKLFLNNVCGKNTYEAVSALAQNCRQLHTLHIRSELLTDIDIQALCDNGQHLKHIELSYCHNLTDASLTAIANTYPQLQTICTQSNSITDDGLIFLADKCHELRSLTIWSDNITNRGLTALWAANPNLMDVDISGNELSDYDIIHLVQCCPVISFCNQVTDDAVIAVAEHCPQLRLLNIYRCYRVSDASLIALGQHSHELKSINISYLKNLSDVGIAALAAGCPLLQEFYADNTNITDAGVVALARGCRDLLKITLNSCVNIGIAAVSAIAENCPLLSGIALQDCHLVDDACLYVIAQHCRNLTVLDVRLPQGI